MQKVEITRKGSFLLAFPQCCWPSLFLIHFRFLRIPSATAIRGQHVEKQFSIINNNVSLNLNSAFYSSPHKDTSATTLSPLSQSKEHVRLLTLLVLSLFPADGAQFYYQTSLIKYFFFDSANLNAESESLWKCRPLVLKNLIISFPCCTKKRSFGYPLHREVIKYGCIGCFLSVVITKTIIITVEMISQVPTSRRHFTTQTIKN